MSRQSARAVSERAWRTKRDLSKSFSEEASRAREPVRDLGAKTQIYVGGMAEWSMAVVLKTTVRETVPGVRIPLPPPTYTRATVRVRAEDIGNRSFLVERGHERLSSAHPRRALAPRQPVS
jgi:hypothetical protein